MDILLSYYMVYSLILLDFLSYLRKLFYLFFLSCNIYLFYNVKLNEDMFQLFELILKGGKFNPRNLFISFV